MMRGGSGRRFIVRWSDPESTRELMNLPIPIRLFQAERDIGMRRSLCCSFLVSSLLLAGCAFSRQTVVLTPVGSPPHKAATDSPKGQLRVFSVWDVGNPGETSPYVTYHSGYRVYSPDGRLLRYVDNRASGAGFTTGDPAAVSLEPGHYTVVAREQNSGGVSVPVIIEAGKRTTVRLDGSKPDPANGIGGASVVRLPDGMIVGWSEPGDHGRN